MKQRARGMTKVAVGWVVALAVFQASTLSLTGCSTARRGPREKEVANYTVTVDDPSQKDPAATWVEYVDERIFGSPSPAAGSAGATAGEGAQPASSADEAAQKAESAPTLFRQGRQAAASARYAEALRLFARGAAVASPEQRWIFERASADLELGMWFCVAARARYQHLLRTLPRSLHLALRCNLAVAHLRLEEWDEAEREIDAALSIDADFPEAIKTKGLIAIGRGDVASGERLLREAVSAKREIPEAQIALAEIDAAAGDVASAAARYRYVLQRYREHEATDVSGRWHFLFGPKKSTIRELKERIARLIEEAERSAPAQRGENP